jgi:uncharacterized protein (TIGR03066 family)
MSRIVCSVVAVLSFISVAPAADVPEALIGRWVSQDAEKRPVEFKKDGTCEYGWEKKDGEWVMVAGTFKMDGDRAKADFNHGGISLGLWWRLKDDHLETPKDVRPVMWKKEVKK